MRLSIGDLTDIIFSSGTVFDGLNTGRNDTESFLRSGDTTGISSRLDQSLLEDLRDAGEYLLAHQGDAVDAKFVMGLNQQITRTGSIQPGVLRRDDQRIGVSTQHGRHEPPALTVTQLDNLIDESTKTGSPLDAAIAIFIELAKAQPFMDGNKRTALFAANAHLIRHGTEMLLTIPVNQARKFNDLLARAYVYDRHDEVADLLRTEGVIPISRER